MIRRVSLPEELEQVILVDQNDREIGTSDKLQAHVDGKLHRAFSVFIFNSQGQLLLQKRACGKYHSGGLWSNTCCGHPRPRESVRHAAERRLHEEMGFTTALSPSFSFQYRADLNDSLTEHEIDHVLTAYHDAVPDPDPEEIAEWRWVGREQLMSEMEMRPGEFTEWFKMIVERGVRWRA